MKLNLMRESGNCKRRIMFRKKTLSVLRSSFCALGILPLAMACVALPARPQFKGLGDFNTLQEPTTLTANPSDGATAGSGNGASQGSSAPNVYLRAEPTKVLAPVQASDQKNEYRFDWPIDQARLSRGFIIGKRPHWGIDLANQKGTPILASERGLVVYTGKGFHGYGNLIVIEHGEEFATLYSHLSEFKVSEGQTVKQGQIIGLMGRTGHATGNHLHFELRLNRQPVNPQKYLPQGF
jgi:murein DD-endopeptidase MepM/ murein hydrolase activator NlpD